MNPRILDFIVGVEASPQPDAGVPSNPNDIITLGFVENTLAGRLVILGTVSAPVLVDGALGLEIPEGEEYEHDYRAYIAGDGGPVTVAADPQIVHSLIDGDTLELRGCSDDDTVKLVNGAGLKMNSDEVVLRAGSVIKFTFNGQDLEESFRNGIEG